MNYFTADPHIYHIKAVNFPNRKGFTPESWAEMFFDLVNKTVTKSDRLFILGDFALGAGMAPFAKARMSLKPKDVWLIKGNHDSSDAVCKKVFGDKFRLVHECKVKGQPCWLSHYPHMFWPKSHYGSFHLFGHVHNQKTEMMNKILPEMRSLDVCPESYKSIFGDWGIFSEDQIYDILIKRKGHDDILQTREKYGSLHEAEQ